MPYVYILRCADGTLYTGWTTDLAARLAEHNAGHGARYTRGRLPVSGGVANPG
jgi:putative endonuclease